MTHSTTFPCVLRPGFTVLELLIVLVVIGLLAAFVLPKIGDVKEKAFDARAQNALHRVVLAQEMHFEEFGRYAEHATDDESAVNDSTLHITRGEVAILFTTNDDDPAKGYLAGTIGFWDPDTNVSHGNNYCIEVGDGDGDGTEGDRTIKQGWYLFC